MGQVDAETSLVWIRVDDFHGFSSRTSPPHTALCTGQCLTWHSREQYLACTSAALHREHLNDACGLRWHPAHSRSGTQTMKRNWSSGPPSSYVHSTLAGSPKPTHRSRRGCQTPAGIRTGRSRSWLLLGQWLRSLQSTRSCADSSRGLSSAQRWSSRSPPCGRRVYSSSVWWGRCALCPAIGSRDASGA